MNARVMTLVLVCLTFGAAPAAKMTHEQARSRIPGRPLPAFWVGDVKNLAGDLATLKLGAVRTLAKSPGGREIALVTYGQRETVQHRANFNSAIGGRDPSAYMDKAARTRPVILLLGPVHGHEVEGLTGLMNLIQVMETGRDRRGRDQSDLRALGQRCRLLIIPQANPDGIARFEPRTMVGMSRDDCQFWGMGTWADHTIAVWPDSKRQHPRTGPQIGFMGCYFNDAGINPMHDEFFAPMSTEAPAILRLAAEEGPDLAVSLHTHQSAPAILRPAYVPTETQEEGRRLSEQLYALLKARNLPHGPVYKASPEGGTYPSPFNLVSALYHVSGATTLTFECPDGIVDEKSCQVSFEQILDIQLTLYEALMRHALAKEK